MRRPAARPRGEERENLQDLWGKTGTTFFVVDSRQVCLLMPLKSLWMALISKQQLSFAT